MIAKLRAFMATEVFKYLFFGVLATLVYMVSRTLIFQFTQQGTLSAVLANAIAIIFAFFTNDMFVFNQEKTGMVTRFVKFVGARLLTLVLDLALAYFLVDTYPEIIGQFVGHRNRRREYPCIDRVLRHRNIRFFHLFFLALFHRWHGPRSSRLVELRQEALQFSFLILKSM